MLIADTHVHVYPAYQAAEALVKAHLHLSACGHSPAQFDAGLFLAERSDCHFFSDVMSGCNIPTGFDVERTGDADSLRLIQTQKKICLHLFAGRQVVTSEGLEILSLISANDIPSGKPAAETLKIIRDGGGLPVLSWAPGKWLFKRGQLIRAIIESRGTESLLIGDTSMRACGLPEPSLMKLGRKKGLPVVAGTDPLPFAGDEFITGTYGISSLEFDAAHPASSSRTLLAEGKFIIAGHRNRPVDAVARWRKNWSAGRR